MPKENYVCQYCGVIKLHFFQLTRHLKNYHENAPNFVVQCNADGCKSRYRRVDSFTKHVSRQHKSLFQNDESENVSFEPGNGGAELADFSENTHIAVEQRDAADVVSNESGCRTIRELFDNVSSHASKFILSVREQHLLPSVVHERITSSMHSLVASALTDYASVVKNVMQNSEGSEDLDMLDILNIQPHLENFGEQFKSEYHLLRYLKQTGQIVMPSTFSVDAGKHTFQYVSLLKVLQKFLSLDVVYSHILGRQQPVVANDVLTDYCDGDAFHSDDFFTANPGALRIHMYADEFEPCNPIGSDRGKHKITAFYYTVGNLHPKYRSQLKFIFLAILVDYEIIRMKGNDYGVILEPLINDLRILQETGIIVNVGGVLQNVKGKLVTVSGDNLTAHDLAGFQRHFNSGRICRSCFVDHADIACKYVEDDVQMRTAEAHSYHLDGVAANPKNASVYGVVKQCAFAELQVDSNIFGLFPHDIMHDVLEGVIPVTVRLVLLRYLNGDPSQRQHVTLSDLNSAIDSCDLTCASNRPNHLTATAVNTHLSGSASHKLELFLMLPRILAPFVDVSVIDDVWSVYLLLREICDILFAPAVERDQLGHLQHLIATFLGTFVQVFGVDKFLPKFHYMMHYPRQIALFGPLKNLWCMRFEGKHQYFKKVAVVANNSKNFCYTLAKRHQLRMCWEMSADDIFECKENGCRSRTYAFDVLGCDIRDIVTDILNVPVTGSEQIASVNFMFYDGMKIALNKVYVVDVAEEEQVPVFCVVKFIICVRESWLLCIRLLIPNFFEQKYHAFCVQMCDGWHVIRPNQLLDSNPVDFFDIDGQSYANMRYAILKH